MARPEETLAESRARQLAATGKFSDLAALRRQLSWEGFCAIDLRHSKVRVELMDIIDASRPRHSAGWAGKMPGTDRSGCARD